MPLGLALYAMTPDFMYSFNPFHRDWMDVFLFHVALDEILPFALTVLAVLWIILLIGYSWFRAQRSAPQEARMPEAHGPAQEHSSVPLSVHHRHWLGVLLVVAVITMMTLVTSGVVAERSAHSPLIRVGQRAPDFVLPSTSGSVESLDRARGHPVMLAFVPSVLCDFCREQLRTIQAVLPQLHARGVIVFAISVDTLAVQQAAVAHLGLSYPLLPEAPTMGQHLVGSAYGVYHVAQGNSAPVDANAIFVIDAREIVRAVRVEPERALTAPEILALVNSAFDLTQGCK